MRLLCRQLYRASSLPRSLHRLHVSPSKAVLACSEPPQPLPVAVMAKGHRCHLQIKSTCARPSPAFRPRPAVVNFRSPNSTPAGTQFWSLFRCRTLSHCAGNAVWIFVARSKLPSLAAESPSEYTIIGEFVLVLLVSTADGHSSVA